MDTAPPPLPERLDVAVVGAGQAGLAAGYFLQRHNRDAARHGRRPLAFALFDASPSPGGAWPHVWDSLELFSPADHSSLPGRPMPRAAGAAADTPTGNPSARDVVDYLTDYERRYRLPVHRPVRVLSVAPAESETDRFVLDLDDGRRMRAAAVISATGTFTRPFWPRPAGEASTNAPHPLRGARHLHSAQYRRPEEFAGQRVLVVGGGNSGPQVAADLMPHAHVTWATARPPRFMPDDVDGRVLFRVASARVAGETDAAVSDLGDIVVVPSVRRARDEWGLHAVDLDEALAAGGPRDGDAHDGAAAYDAVVWSTGFRPELRHLRPCGLERTERGTPRMSPAPPTAVQGVPGLYLLGYGDWCGPASATLIGVGPHARRTVEDVVTRAVTPHAPSE